MIRRHPLLGIVLIALAVRLAVAALCYHDLVKPQKDHWSFGYETGRIARSIASGQGFANPLLGPTGPTAWMAPLYPYLLAGIFKLFGIYSGTSAGVILGLQALFAALTTIPLFLIAQRCFGVPTAYLAAWVWALFPYSIYLASDFVWESALTTLLLTWLIWLAMNFDRPRGWWAWAGWGLLWGVAALANPAVLAVLPVGVGWVVLRLRRQRVGWIARLGALVVVLVLTVLPWELRNHRRLHRWIPLRDNFWLEVYVGNNWKTLHGWPDDRHPTDTPAEWAAFQQLGEVRYMDLKREQALAFIHHHPVIYLRLVVRRILNTWTGYWNFAPAYLAEEPYDRWNIFFATPLSLLALTGLVVAWRQRIEGSGLLLAVFAVYPVVYYLTHSAMRYRHPIDPEIVMVAAYGGLWLREAVWVPEWLQAALETIWAPSDEI